MVPPRTNSISGIANNAVDSEATPANLPTGKTLQFRVYAANKAGQGPVSNTVEVRL